MLQAHDIVYEIGHAFEADAYTESDGYNFELTHDMNADNAVMQITHESKPTQRFRITVTEI